MPLLLAAALAAAHAAEDSFLRRGARFTRTHEGRLASGRSGPRPRPSVRDLLIPPNELAEAVAAAPRLRFRSDGSFRILTVTDAHYNRKSCRQVAPEEKPFCNSHNTTDFLERVLDADGPFDLVVYIGDAIDQACRVVGAWRVDPASGERVKYWTGLNATECMRRIYGVAQRRGIPFAATLGNHDDDVRHWTKWKLVDYIARMPGALTRAGPSGPARDRPGNFHIDLVGAPSPGDEERVLFRTFHMMGDVDSEKGYTWEQASWLEQLGRLLRRDSPSQPPSLVFGHVALPEFRDAAIRGNVSGHYEERIGAPPLNVGMFASVRGVGAVAMFVGHDHVNDFCGGWEGVELCYCGSPGFGGYGRLKPYYHRRTRVVQITDWGAEVRSWLRLADEDLSVQSREALWRRGVPPGGLYRPNRTPGRLQPRVRTVEFVQEMERQERLRHRSGARADPSA
eukprot:TRINITY_DN61105_c0_g1_i1.p1 TRINITY_DN61105_c0_g1~~TRINITY_DN61105_c0_g1_i1.p1  ORF type:complete len:477 (+),score=126.25 TRINITY_DN61105_c0_g1_i1:75-1433(+)